jgi:hypothetical protein
MMQKRSNIECWHCLVYLAIRDDLANIRQVVLDQDYTGNAAETTVRNILLNLLQQQNPSITPAFVRFQRVRGSNADKMARDVYMGQKPPTRKIGLAELENILKGIDKAGDARRET